MKTEWVLAAIAAAFSAASLAAPPYPLPEWSDKADSALKELFEKTTGQRFALVLWEYGWFGKAGKPEKALSGATVLGEAKSVSPRLSRGAVRSFYKESINADGWWPGKPFRWAEVERKYSRREDYAIVAPPENDRSVEKYAELARRVYNQPIFVDPGIGDGDIVAATDFLWRGLVKFLGKEEAGPGEEMPGVNSFYRGSTPFWANLCRITRTDKSIQLPGIKPRAGDLTLVLSEEGDGCLAVVLRKESAGFKVLTEFGVDF